MFIVSNPNPRPRKNSQDCAIRAIANATGDSWKDVFALLCDAGAAKLDAPTSDASVRHALGMIGAQKVVNTKGEDGRRLTVEQFADRHPRGRFVVRVSGHWTCVADGNVIDSWDCSWKCVFSAWEVL